MKSNQHNNWDEEDRSLEKEYADVIPLIRESPGKIRKVPRYVTRKILSYAREANSTDLEKNWLLGQGPWVILVTLILFATIILVLLTT